MSKMKRSEKFGRFLKMNVIYGEINKMEQIREGTELLKQIANN